MKIKTFVVGAQKAVATLIGTLTTLAAAGLLPEPLNLYVGAVTAVLTVLATYDLPYVAEVVEDHPDSATHLEYFETDESDVYEPATDVIPVVSDDTAGIPVIEGESAAEWVPPFPGAERAEDLLARLRDDLPAPA